MFNLINNPKIRKFIRCMIYLLTVLILLKLLPKHEIKFRNLVLISVISCLVFSLMDIYIPSICIDKNNI